MKAGSVPPFSWFRVLWKSPFPKVIVIASPVFSFLTDTFTGPLSQDAARLPGLLPSIHPSASRVSVVDPFRLPTTFAALPPARGTACHNQNRGARLPSTARGRQFRGDDA